jgi:hypothetical protein
MAGWNTPARNAAINKRPCDLQAGGSCRRMLGLRSDGSRESQCRHAQGMPGKRLWREAAPEVRWTDIMFRRGRYRDEISAFSLSAKGD